MVSLVEGLRRDIVMDIRLLRTEMGRSRNDISSLAEMVVEKGLRRRFRRRRWKHIPLETAHSSGDGAFLWRRRFPLETAHSCGDGAFLWRRRMPLERGYSSGDGTSFGDGGFLWRRRIPLETAHSSGDGAFLWRRHIPLVGRILWRGQIPLEAAVQALNHVVAEANSSAVTAALGPLVPEDFNFGRLTRRVLSNAGGASATHDWDFRSLRQVLRELPSVMPLRVATQNVLIAEGARDRDVISSSESNDLCKAHGPPLRRRELRFSEHGTRERAGRCGTTNSCGCGWITRPENSPVPVFQMGNIVRSDERSTCENL